MWFGADPGGAGCFGVARLNVDGTFDTKLVTGVIEAAQFIDAEPSAVGIDAPMWWSSSAGGGRKADQRLRDHYGISSGTIQSVNSLRGAVIVQGPMLVLRLREKFSQAMVVTETHPKALLLAMRLSDTSWDDASLIFGVRGERPKSEHERDALLSAVAARAGGKTWTHDLSLDRYDDEVDPALMWCGSSKYYWFEPIR